MITLRQLEWAAGFLEGEGSFTATHSRSRRGICRSHQVSAVQVQAWPLEKLQRLFGGSLRAHARARPGHQASQSWTLSAIAARGLMMTLFSLLSPRRQAQIRRALARWDRAAPQYRYACPKGHPYDLKRTKRGGRRCSTCHNAARRLKRSAAHRGGT